MLPNEFHFTEEQKHQTLAPALAVVSHVPLLCISVDHTWHLLQTLCFRKNIV